MSGFPAGAKRNKTVPHWRGDDERDYQDDQ